MKVLLVSGRPHAGGRTWRDLLKSDPGVDLVHFTILREPRKLDSTPQRELSLIAFPFRELFEVKLYDFDLIIFDRYRLNRILPDYYFKNIANFVKEGGALLVSAGPDFAGQHSLYSTALASILPGQPTQNVFQKPFKPALNDNGRIHPVTMALKQGEQKWGSWLRQIDLSNDRGDVLMTGLNDSPLLILDRVEDGRVAQLASDHIWLWSRGYDGGGPSQELLRRTVHWLMKEPELDEEALEIDVRGDEIHVRARYFEGMRQPVTLVRPDGVRETLSLFETSRKLFEGKVLADKLGVYAFEKGETQRRFAVIGQSNPPELRDVVSTSKKFAPLIQASRGGVIWASETARPDIRFYRDARSYSGSGWIGLRQNGDYVVNGVQSIPLFNVWILLSALMAFLIIGWWIEGRTR